MPRYGARTDANHAFIAGGLRALGCGVESLATLGKGRPDLLVAVSKTRTIVREVKRTIAAAKRDARAVSEVALNPDQIKWHEAWPGDVGVWRTLDEAIADCFPAGLSRAQQQALAR